MQVLLKTLTWWLNHLVTFYPILKAIRATFDNIIPVSSESLKEVDEARADDAQPAQGRDDVLQKG